MSCSHLSVIILDTPLLLWRLHLAQVSFSENNIIGKLRYHENLFFFLNTNLSILSIKKRKVKEFWQKEQNGLYIVIKWIAVEVTTCFFL